MREQPSLAPPPPSNGIVFFCIMAFSREQCSGGEYCREGGRERALPSQPAALPVSLPVRPSVYPSSRGGGGGRSGQPQGGAASEDRGGGAGMKQCERERKAAAAFETNFSASAAVLSAARDSGPCCQSRTQS